MIVKGSLVQSKESVLSKIEGVANTKHKIGDLQLYGGLC